MSQAWTAKRSGNWSDGEMWYEQVEFKPAFFCPFCRKRHRSEEGCGAHIGSVDFEDHVRRMMMQEYSKAERDGEAR